MTQNLNELAIQVNNENKDELNNLLSSLREAIDKNGMPTTKDYLPDQKSSTKIKRPPNSNIIYTNLLNKFGFLYIIGKFCDKHRINKQKLLPLSKKVSKILWEELPERYQKFFKELASILRKKHKNLYPDYIYKPKRNRNDYSTFKPYELKTKTTPIKSIPGHKNEQLISINNLISTYKSYEQMEEEDTDYSDSSVDELSIAESIFDGFAIPSSTLFPSNDFNNDSEEVIRNSICWSDVLEARLCELYMKDDIVDIFWGRLIEDHIAESTTWNVYVITRGLHHPYTKTEIIEDGQIIHFIAEEAKFANTIDPLPSSIEIPQDLKEKFDEALDNELGISFREAHYNLVGISTGYKRIKGQLTEIPAIILYVRQKGILRRGCDGIFPKEICGFPVDVIEACAAVPCAGSGIDSCRRYQGDVKLGSSIGVGSEEENITGTLSAVVYDNLSCKVGIISCEHVLKFNKSDSRKDIAIYQPSYNDLFEPKKRLVELRRLLKEPEIKEDDIESITDDIEIEERKLTKAMKKDSTLATYVRGMRENFIINNKKYGIDAGFCDFNNGNRTLCPTKFTIPSNYFEDAGFSTCLEGTYTYDELKNFNYDTRVFKVGRTTGLTLGQLLPTDQAIACNLTNESIKNAKKLAMEKHVPCYNNTDQKIFVGYMKSHLDSEIRQTRKKCYPVEWFDRQLAFRFELGEFECGDSGASIVDKKGKALGILHAKWITSYQTFGIVSPYFAVLEALNVRMCYSSNSISPTIISSSITLSSSSSYSFSSSSSSSTFNLKQYY
ncbi:hypothetical protein C1645_817347 [Glomus cerebriforme]|uniref:HMG box domain-containing protein n=1 Tax=Glomus cerebriforme TaxID=658196 RepID=A0A397TJC9_9GLOM|nr:hypothetical protein C1645_817347 [Glomus cerebriforme]